MNILADTHILLWALTDDKQLSKAARKYLSDPDNSIYYSAISVWEVEIKHKLRPDVVMISGKEFASYCKQAGFYSISFTENHAALCESLSYSDNAPVHKDPFDKALLAQAKADSLKLMTHDKKVCEYTESCILAV